MASTLYNLDFANLFVDDDNPNKSEFLTMESVTIPGLEEQTKAHNPGGGVGVIDLGQRSIVVSMLQFKLKGINPNTMTKFMPIGRSVTPYTIRANIRDVANHTDIPLKAVVRGRLTKMQFGAFQKEDGLSNDYEIKEIQFYQLHFQGQEKIYYDWFQGPRGVRIDGRPVFDQAAINVGL